MEGQAFGMAIPYSRTIIGSLPWYSVLVVTGIAVAVWLAGREEKRLGLPKDTTVDLALVVVPCGIVGARLYYVLMRWELFAANPVSALYVWQGGLAIYGAVIGGALGACVYARRKRIAFAKLADMIAPGLLLAQAIGRWGNYFNMEAYGPVIAEARLQFFPLAVFITADGEWHAATFFYESMWNLLGFAALWLLRKRQRETGDVFAWYLLIYGAGRFVIEQLREDSLYIGSLRASQYLSLILCAGAALVLLWRTYRHQKFVFGVAVCAMWIARWAVLEIHPVYAVLLLTAGIAALWLKRDQRRALLWLTMALLLDGLGLLAAITQWPVSTAVGSGLHALLCSLTLPMGVYGLCTIENEMQRRGG